MAEYIEQAMRTEAPITPEVDKRLKKAARLLHGAMGLCTETGEFMDALKRWIYYGKEPDFTNLEEEVGDLFWYCAIILDEIGFRTGEMLDFEKVQRKNIAKLKARYPDKFTEQCAIEREVEVEREVLENSAKPSIDLYQGNIQSDFKTGEHYLVLRLDGDTHTGHAARMGARTYAKELWPEETHRGLAERVKNLVASITEDLPPLKVKAERGQNE